jgi:hypothetical protein
MSFLDSNISEHLSARLTQKGRNAIAKGNFSIDYFAVGDSEFNYIYPYLSGSTNHQKVFTPFDKDTQIKYPLKFDGVDLSGTTVYGIPIQNSETETLRNAMGPAGFISDYKPFNSSTPSGSTIGCISNRISFANISGTTTLTVTKLPGTTYYNCQNITLAFDRMYSGSTGDIIVSGHTTSLNYKLINITTGSTTEVLTLDRNTPDLSALSGYANVICNKCDMEFPFTSDVDNIISVTGTSGNFGTVSYIPQLPDNTDQQNPWTLDVIWDQKPIGMTDNDRNLSGYTSSRYSGIKNLLGYTSNTGQTFTNYSGVTITGTTYVNSSNEVKELKSEDQRCLAIVHFTELGDIVNYPDRSFKYDDYISDISGSVTNNIAYDVTGTTISDLEYFEVYIPFLHYHRNDYSILTGGTVFYMETGSTNYNYVKGVSTINDKFSLKYRRLLDVKGNSVGKVFMGLKTIVFDDQEIVAALDYKSNRNYTLPAPKVGTNNSDTSSSLSFMTGSTNQVAWVTYYLTHSSDDSLNALPCNYFITVTGSSTPSNLTLKFENNEFQRLNTTFSNITNNFVANEFFILTQTGFTGNQPDPDSWVKMDFTSEAGGSSLSNLVGTTFTINKTKYDGGTTFNLGSHMDNVSFSGATGSYFGDEQPFPGSVKLVRATDVEVLNFLVNLPSGKFEKSQNPTWSSGNSKITEIALMDSNKNALVMAKTSKPITRTGTQVFSIKLDF